ncbi:HlyD family efflux transporter periplasmic adaptor subunit [Rhizobium glycinendophyticum]|uniref:HlyD family secretion protein n=1 Tax=Rhizobium glycinendophyticum TaxID=2589807 RepID=A0A504U885_9HYPH|nr:HlyD family efflux transporter periplasmic adaptor subunit [Rhizobium glycinendophyticum]TPP06745.1 HlyD family secretion protein [Rhizobium glycinendophyticum]
MDIDTKAARDPASKPLAQQPSNFPVLLDNGTEHPKTNIPFAAIIDGRHFSGQSISLVSATVSGLAGPELEGKERIAVLRFDFDGYTVSLQVDVRINRTHAETGELRLDFLEPTGEHLPTLRYLLNSYIAGDITSLDGIISLRERAAVAGGKKQTGPATLGNFIGRTVKVVATVALSLTLAVVAAKLVYERVFSKEVQQLAVLSTGGQALRAVASGQISYLNLGAKRGEVLYTLQSISGTTLSINMPCDCKVLPMNAGEGSTVMAGDTIVEIIDRATAPVVQAVVTSEQAKQLVAGDIAELSLADGQVAFGTLARDAQALKPVGNQGEVRALIAPQADLGEAAIGAPVSVRIINKHIFAVRQKVAQWFDTKSTN